MEYEAFNRAIGTRFDRPSHSKILVGTTISGFQDINHATADIAITGRGPSNNGGHGSEIGLGLSLQRWLPL